MDPHVLAVHTLTQSRNIYCLAALSPSIRSFTRIL